MKLYTEEQVKDAFIRGVLKGMSGSTLSTYELFEMYISELTPIELPSDGEIAYEAVTWNVYNMTQLEAFRHGVNWTKEQILNQNK